MDVSVITCTLAHPAALKAACGADCPSLTMHDSAFILPPQIATAFNISAAHKKI